MRRFALLAALVGWSLSSSPRDARAQPAAPEPPTQPVPPAAPKQPALPPPAAPPPGAVPAGAGPTAPVQQPSQEQPTTRPQEPSPLPPEPPSSAPSPVQPKPQVPPLGSPAPSPAPGDQGAGEEPRLPPPESSIGPEVFAGVNARLNDNEGFRDADRAGLSFGLGAWFAPNRAYSLGLAYQRTSLGTAQTAPGESSLSARYNLNTVWFGGRAFPWRNDVMGVFILLELGASWQNVSASGTRPTASFTVPAEAFACSATDGPGFALGGGGGLDVQIERQLAFIVQADVSGHRLTGEPVDGCAIGAGAATNLGAHIGFLYRFDLDPEVRHTGSRIRSDRSALLR